MKKPDGMRPEYRREDLGKVYAANNPHNQATSQSPRQLMTRT